MRRLPLLLACLALPVLVAGCGNRHDEPRTFAETEGLYLEIGELEYQIQLSRQLNPNDPEDAAYLRGIPEYLAPLKGDETWFGVFLRVENQTDERLPVADDFEIVDTQETSYDPVDVDPEQNPFAYVPGDLPGDRLLPDPDSPAGQGPTKGGLILFRLPASTLQRRPLEFKIKPPEAGGEEGTVDLDV